MSPGHGSRLIGESSGFKKGLGLGIRALGFGLRILAYFLGYSLSKFSKHCTLSLELRDGSS